MEGIEETICNFVDGLRVDAQCLTRPYQEVDNTLCVLMEIYCEIPDAFQGDSLRHT